jgi:DNA-binding MarR family transcriptional regulator
MAPALRSSSGEKSGLHQYTDYIDQSTEYFGRVNVRTGGAAFAGSTGAMLVERPGTTRDLNFAMAGSDRELYEKPGHLIRRLQQISLALFMDEARDFGITPVQYSAILAIDIHPGIDQTALCNIVALDRSTIGDVVTRLERKKLIKRTPGAKDRRTNLLYTTAAGRKLIQDIEPAVQATQKRILEPLSVSERAAFVQMLKRLVHVNNEHSRAPMRIDDRTQQPRAGAESKRVLQRQRNGDLRTR